MPCPSELLHRTLECDFVLCPLLASWFLSCVFSFVFLFFGIHHFCLPMPWRDFLVQGANWKRWRALAQRRQTSLRLHLSRARGVVVSHPLSMREALGSIPSVSICNLANCLPRERRLARAPAPAVGPASVDTSAFVGICCACGSAAWCGMSVPWVFRLAGCL